MTAIVDYGVGNLFSLKSSFDALGIKAVVTGNAEDLRAAVDAIMESDEVIVEKKTKSGIRPANIRPESLEAEAISVLVAAPLHLRTS